MDITNTLPPGMEGAIPPATSLGSGQNLGKDEFLLMLVTQLNNQDPLNPLQGHEFASQLAQFTSVEQLMSMNNTLADQSEVFTLLAEVMGETIAAQGQWLGLLTDSMNRSAATGLIGLSVDVPGNVVGWDGSEPVSLAFNAEAPAAMLQVAIRDESGAVVHQIEIEGSGAGRQEVVWDGTGPDGEPLPAGIYTFDVQAFDDEGQPVEVMPLMRGIVDRVSFGPDGVFVWVNGVAVPYTDIQSIGWPEVAPEAEPEIALEAVPEAIPTSDYTYEEASLPRSS